MPPKKKPLEDAWKRLQEKLNNVEEQSEYICQFINDLVNKASNPAKKLLEEKDRKKFFQKYSSVSQELEKCLDCLLLISDSVTALGEEDTLGTSEGYSSSTTSEHGENTEQHAASSKKPGSNKKGSQASDDKISKGQHNTSQLSGDSVRLCLENDLQNNSGTQKSTEGRGVVESLCTSSQKSCAAKSPGNDEHASIFKHPSDSNLTNPPPVEQILQIQAKQTVLEDPNKLSQKLSSASQEASKSGKGLNLISKLIDAEPAKQFTDHPKTEDTSLRKPLKDSRRKGSSSSSGSPPSDVFQDCRTEPTKQSIDHKQTDYPSFAKPPKDHHSVKRRRSSSSVSALSDIILDIKKSPRVVNVSAENIPTKVQLPEYPFRNGQRLEVVVNEVLSPWEFWVQPVGSELDLLMEEMCIHYAKLAAAGYKGGLISAPAVGDFCCAKFTQDDTWYRALVTAVEESDKGPTIEVLCVDDGNREKVGLSRLRPLEEKFLKLPCQAWCCALSGVQPVNPQEQKPGFIRK